MLIQPIGDTVARLACIADVHGNTTALDAVLASAEFAEAEAVAFLGCITTGPDPLGVLERCSQLTIPTYFIAGNGERSVIELADGEGDPSWELGPWIVEQHGLQALEMIRSWPAQLTASVEGLGKVRLCHGSPRSDIELLTPQTPVERIRDATAVMGERVLVHGHTHLQYDRLAGDIRVIGPGSVGQPYTEGAFGARWALLAAETQLIVTAYDLETARRRVEKTGYPSDRHLATLESPPTPAEVIADAESRVFSN